MTQSKRRKGGFAGVPTPSQALRATTPALGQSPRTEKGRSALPNQKSARTEQDVRSQLLDKIGQEGIDALFAAAQRKGR